MSQRFSYSRLNTFNNCREAYRINYIKGIRKDNENIEAYLGSCVHYVIEDIYNNANSSINFDEIVYMYKKSWDDNWHDSIYLIDGRKKVSQYYSLGIECLKNFYKRNIENNSSFLKNTLESEMEVEFSMDGIDFRGIIDRLDYDSQASRYIVNDYKTSKRVISPKKAQRDLQLGLYLVAIHQKFNIENPVILKWHFLRYGVDIVVSPKTEDVDFIKKKLVQKAKAILDMSSDRENFYPNENILCNWCHYWEECTAKFTSNPAKRILK